MMGRRKSRIFASILQGGFIHIAGMLIIWDVGIKSDMPNPMITLKWYAILPIIIHTAAIAISGCMNMLKKGGRISDAVFEQVMALLYASICCANYIILRRFDLSFLIMVLPVVMLLLEHRSARNIPQVLIIIAFYELMQFLPIRLPGEPLVFLDARAQRMFGIYISMCIMFLLWQTKDAYAYSIKEREESELRLNAQREFLLKKNQDVRGAIHNVKGTGEMILRNNVSYTGADNVVKVMDACDRITELVDRIIETSGAKVYKKTMSAKRDRCEHRE